MVCHPEPERADEENDLWISEGLAVVGIDIRDRVEAIKSKASELYEAYRLTTDGGVR